MSGCFLLDSRKLYWDFYLRPLSGHEFMKYDG